MTSTDSLGQDATIAGDAPQRREEEQVLAQGSVVGRYFVLARVGAGGMGVVHAAYDPELDRKVALKVLHFAPGGSQSTEGRTRLIREAQALAKLSHPNVVAVYDVGTVDERVWMTMELVQGQTLGQWLEERPRSWPEVLRVMSAAGEGLAAAHEAGLLHRDFKPDNVMIDTSGRVRVMDFGLARARSRGSVGRTITGLKPRTEPEALSLQVTRVGSLMGTPGYMSAEQLAGQEADARSDEFSFCVTLWEALYGQRPFAGETLPELAARVLAGELERPPAGRRVPAWLRRACERGLATDPSARFASLRELLDALGQGRTRARHRIVLVGGAALLGLGLGALGINRWDRARQIAACEVEGASITEVWNDDARARLRAGLLATGVGYAETTADKVLPWLDREVSAWAEHRTRVCVDATVTGTWDAQTSDRAQWCLEERRLGIQSLVQVLSEADAAGVQHAVKATSMLEPSQTCVDEAALDRAPPPPAPELRPRIAEVRALLAKAAVLHRTGQPDAGLELIEATRDEVAALGWGPLSAGAKAQEGALLASTGSLMRAEDATVAAYLLAAESGAWSQAAEAATRLVALVGRTQARPAEGRLWAEHARVAGTFTADPLGFLESARLSGLAGIAFSAGAYDEAQSRYERALELVRLAVDPEHPEIGRLLVNLGAVAWSKGSTDDARRAFEQALAILEDALGPEHPDIAVVLGNLGALRFEAKDYPQTKALYERALEINTAARPPGHPDLAANLDNLALVLDAMGDHEEALTLELRAITAWEEAMGPEYPSLAVSWANLAGIHVARQRPTEALAAYERAIAIYDRHEGAQQYEHRVRFNLAKLLVQTGGDRARALAQAQMARDGYRELGEGKAKNLAEVEEWIASLPEAEEGESVGPPLERP